MRYERADLVRYSIALLMAAALLAAAVASSGKNQLLYAIVALTPAAYAAMVLWSGAKPLDELADVRELFPLDYDPPDTLPDEEITPEAMRARRQAFKQAAAESRRRAADQSRTVNPAAPAGPAAGERQHRGSGVR